MQVGISKLQEGQHMIVGTPGRVFDMLNRGNLGKCNYCSTILYKNACRTACPSCWAKIKFFMSKLKGTLQFICILAY